MQVSSNTAHHKKTSLEKQTQGNDYALSKNNLTDNSLIEGNNNSVKTGEKNETSQYLKVLSRVENLISQKKLPDAALEGFIGAIKNQIH